MKLFSAIPLASSVRGWDGPWTGVNYINDEYSIISKDLNELSRDPKLTFIEKV